MGMATTFTPSCRRCGAYGAGVQVTERIGLLSRLPLLWRLAPSRTRPGFYCLDCALTPARAELRRLAMPEPRVFRAGWRAALSGLPREACRYDDPADREAWNEGYSDAERERAKDVADVRVAVAMDRGSKDRGSKEACDGR